MIELRWDGKDEALKVEEEAKTHLLEFDKNFSFGEKNSENMIVQGDNLQVLKSLLPFYRGQVKCIYIDPPYNTGSAFENYNDNFPHSAWLNMMYPRLELLKDFLSDNGSIWVQIDDKEQAHLRVMMDEIFGRKNFVQMISVKRASPAGFKVINPGPLTVTEYVFFYCKDKEQMFYIPQRIPVDYDKNYDSYIVNPNDTAQKWKIEKLTTLLYQRWNVSSWQEVKQKYGRGWKIIRDAALGELALELKDCVVSVRDPHKPSNLIKNVMNESKRHRGKVFVIERENYNPIFIYNGGSLSFYRDKLRNIDGVLTSTELLTDFWSDINYAGIASEGNVVFKNGKKPEMLVKRILEMTTNEGDLVMDIFLGSGTTVAVAHKMNRKYIGVEIGEQCTTHIVPRLQKVVEGEQSGISKIVNWCGGGGFSFYRLGAKILDVEGKINSSVTFEQLANFVWFSATKTPYCEPQHSPLLGIYNGKAIYLLYNGILKDKSVKGGNILTKKILSLLPKFDGEKIIYGSACRIDEDFLEENKIIFRQIPKELNL